MEEAKRYSILIVDDEESNIMALSHILSSSYSLIAVKDGQDAIDMATELLPDLILLDIIMPDMDGYAVISALKGEEKTADIPVIFVTGLSNADDEEKGLALGAADYISKPFSPAIVKLRVQNQIRLIEQMRKIIEKETAEKSSRTRSEFLSRMSHEMRTPMNAIVGMTNLAMNTPDAEKRGLMLDKISHSSSLMLSIIDNMLVMSDIEDNKVQLAHENFSFAAVIRNVLNVMGAEARKKQQALTANIDPSIPDLLVGDERRIFQVIFNLLSNAIRFTPEQGSIQINAFVREVSEETLTLQIEVVDTGVGISETQQAKLFSAFESSDDVGKRQFSGTGLGLTISEHFVELMSGTIWVESELGKGSTFSFTSKVELKAPEELLDDEAPTFHGKTALLAEDIEVNREIVIAMLEDTGLEIVNAEDGKVALDLFVADPERFDIVLMDINMPVMDGVEATQQIRASGSAGLNIPIIAMTANVLMSEVEEYFAAGMTDHIGKPLDYDKLLSKLKSYLKA